MSKEPNIGLSRILDIGLATAGLLIFSPLMALIALVIRLESPGPIFFAQQRLGRGGRRFNIYKFRKFRHDVGTNGMPLTLRNDHRMTRVGQFLARTKLDELPQLYNILRGDMAVVGPRPESDRFVDCFKGYHLGLLDYTPGIFGPSQVAFRDEASYFPPTDQERYYREVLFPLKANADLSYYRSRSLVGDMVWLLRGVLAVAGWGYRASGPSIPPTSARSFETQSLASGNLTVDSVAAQDLLPHGLAPNALVARQQLISVQPHGLNEAANVGHGR